MDYTIRHVSGPSPEPVTVEELKAHLLIEDLTLTTAQQSDLASKLRAARNEAEGYLSRLIGAQTVDVLIDEWPYWWTIPVRPIISVDGVYYTDENGFEHVLDVASYQVATSRGVLWPKPGTAWPSAELWPFGGVRIRVTAGIQPESDGASPANLRYSDNIRQAILLRAATLYNIREDMTLGTTMQAGKVGTFEALLMGERLVYP